MLYVRKRSGREENFDIEKVKHVLAEASDDIRQPLAASTLDSIARELEKLVEGKQTVTSQQLYVMTVGILATRGLTELAKQYIGFSQNAFHS